MLDAANCLIAASERQYRKNLFSNLPNGGKPSYVTVEDSDSEAEYVVKQVLANREEGMPLKQQAVLFRGSHHSDRLELELVRRDIPYVKYGGLKFLEAGHVKDMLSILKWAENPHNQVAAFRVLKLLPGMGPAYAARVFEKLQASEFSFAALEQMPVPATTRHDWPVFCNLMMSLSARELRRQRVAGTADGRAQVVSAAPGKDL